MERIFVGLPKVFTSVVADAALSFTDLTFCLWRTDEDNEWQCGRHLMPESDDDGALALLFILDGNPSTYHQWASAYYEISLALSGIEAIYAHAQLTPSLVYRLNQHADLSAVDAEARAIDYPMV